MPGRRSPRPSRGSRAGDGEAEQAVPELGGVHAERAARVGAAEPPAGGDQRGAVPELPAPAAEREPAGRELVQGVGEREALDGRHSRAG